MTRVNPLVLDGSEVKLRLQAERVATGSAVHVDWLRFTVNLRNAPLPAVDDLFPLPPPAAMPVVSTLILGMQLMSKMGATAHALLTICLGGRSCKI